MKKISIRNYFEPTPKNVQKWLLALKTILATIGGATYFQDPKLAFWILVGGAVLNEFANLFSNGTKENESN
jgi:hypothetical protein